MLPLTMKLVNYLHSIADEPMMKKAMREHGSDDCDEAFKFLGSIGIDMNPDHAAPCYRYMGYMAITFASVDGVAPRVNIGVSYYGANTVVEFGYYVEGLFLRHITFMVTKRGIEDVLVNYR